MPKAKNPQVIFSSPGQVLKDITLITAGSIISAIAINGILIPNHFASGGVTGIALVIHSLVPALRVEWIYILMNIPMFAAAWMAVGRRFFFYSMVGALGLSLALAYIHVNINLQDKILSALLAGIILGVAVGITFRSSGSQGGMDILAVMLLKRFSINLGNTILFVNAIVLILAACYFSIESALYTLIVIYVTAKVVNILVTGLSQRKAVFIISPHWKIISAEILRDIRRGVTILDGKGGFRGKPESILYTVVTFPEIGELKALIRRIDPDAFVVISNTLEVMNYRIGNQPHW
jgi:uncharacterized membrane-anchored protein YitT (DUF2179 family)